jgi:hypothetical protein
MTTEVSKTILIVDDEEPIRRLLKEWPVPQKKRSLPCRQVISTWSSPT